MAFYIELFIPKLVLTKDTLRVRHRDTPSFDTPVVTGLGAGARQKILIHQVFNRSVKVWARCEDLFIPMFLAPVSPVNSFSTWEKFLGISSPRTLVPGLTPGMFSHLRFE